MQENETENSRISRAGTIHGGIKEWEEQIHLMNINEDPLLTG